MTYKTRPGIELLNICGVHLLVGTRATWDVCPHVRQLPKAVAFAWSFLAKGSKPSVIAEALGFFTHTPKHIAEESIAKLIEKLVAEGYLIEDHSDE